MFKLIKSKIEALKFTGADSLKHLDKIITILILWINRKATGNIPMFIEYSNALIRLEEMVNKELKESEENKFNRLRDETALIIQDLDNDMTASGLNDESLLEKMEGAKITGQRIEIDYCLLMVEQNNIEYFKARKRSQLDEGHDRLHNHYMITNNTLYFEKGTQLPEYIQAEVIEALKETTKNF